MVVGIAKKDELISAVAKGEGNLVAIIGVPTGNDGIAGDAFAADIITDNGTKGISVDYMKNVDVEIKLYDLIQKFIHEKAVIGIQPIGAQGIVGAVTEMAARGNSGVQVRTDGVPLRDIKLTPRDIMVSETWGRMLICFTPENADKVRSLALKHNVEFGVIGKVTSDEKFSLYDGNNLLAQLPVKYLGLGGKAPVYEPAFENAAIKVADCVVDDLPEPDHYPKVAKKMIGSLNLASKKYLSKKFSKSLKAEDTSSKFPSDASIIEIKENGKALVATIDCNPGYMSTDPFIGAQIAVAEAVRNIVCAGGKPLAISDCLNFGNPADPKAYGAFVASVKGIAEACKLYSVPVISGNVSFYNQRSVDGHILPIVPSPIIGMVGILKQAEHHTTLSFKHKGDMIFLIGRSRNDVNGSEYLRMVQGIEVSKPPVYIASEEFELHQVVAGMIDKGLVRSVHDVSNGGLFFTLLECAVPLEFGFDITSDAEIRKDAFLFGEAQSRVVVSVSPEKQDLFVDYMVDQEFPFSILGHVTKGEIRIDDESYDYVENYRKLFESRLKDWVDDVK
jgi:phosphoribosylformylglycinamidine synthase